MRFSILKVLFCFIFLLTISETFSQNTINDTAGESHSLHTELKVYHQFLTPETSLYDGREYAYNLYYPFRINEGTPFFRSKQFDTGKVFYNNILYENVRMLYDEVKGKLVLSDPKSIYLVELITEKISWFDIYGHTFVNLNAATLNNSALHAGFYDLLYDGNISLYNKVSKRIEELNLATEINRTIVESNDYFIKKNNFYFFIKNLKELKAVLADKKKEIDQFIRKNKLKFRKLDDASLIRVITFYDTLDNYKTKEN